MNPWWIGKSDMFAFRFFRRASEFFSFESRCAALFLLRAEATPKIPLLVRCFAQHQYLSPPFAEIGEIFVSTLNRLWKSVSNLKRTCFPVIIFTPYWMAFKLLKASKNATKLGSKNLSWDTFALLAFKVQNIALVETLCEKCTVPQLRSIIRTVCESYVWQDWVLKCLLISLSLRHCEFNIAFISAISHIFSSDFGKRSWFQYFYPGLNLFTVA